MHVANSSESLPELPPMPRQRHATAHERPGYLLVAAKGLLLTTMVTGLGSSAVSPDDAPMTDPIVAEAPLHGQPVETATSVRTEAEEFAARLSAERARQAELAKQAAIAAGPEAVFNPESFANDQFIGAITIDHVGNRDLPWVHEADALYDKYYQRKGQTRPAMDTHAVHRLVTSRFDGVTDSIPDESLSQGVVVYRTSSPDVMIMAGHNITPLDAPVELDGQVYNQSQMFANAVNVPGDSLTTVVPSTEYDDYVDTYTYVNTGHFLVDVATQGGEVFQPVDGKKLLYTYKCWTPGLDGQRWVDVWELQAMATTPGSTSPVGDAVVSSGSL